MRKLFNDRAYVQIWNRQAIAEFQRGGNGHQTVVSNRHYIGMLGAHLKAPAAIRITNNNGTPGQIFCSYLNERREWKTSTMSIAAFQRNTPLFRRRQLTAAIQVATASGALEFRNISHAPIAVDDKTDFNEPGLLMPFLYYKNDGSGLLLNCEEQSPSDFTSGGKPMAMGEYRFVLEWKVALSPSLPILIRRLFTTVGNRAGTQVAIV